jgi:hypothetical protein
MTEIEENGMRRVFPSSPRRGGCGINEKSPFRSAADGVVSEKNA